MAYHFLKLKMVGYISEHLAVKALTLEKVDKHTIVHVLLIEQGMHCCILSMAKPGNIMHNFFVEYFALDLLMNSDEKKKKVSWNTCEGVSVIFFVTAGLGRLRLLMKGSRMFGVEKPRA